MERAFFIKRINKGGCYCSKCGKRQLQDRYNMKKHAELCGFTKRDYTEVIEEKDSYGYRLTPKEEGLLLEICRPKMRPIPGFTDRFLGVDWTPVFRTFYPKNSKKPEILMNETLDSLENWLTLIRMGRVQRTQQENDAVIIHKVFPSVLGVYSLEMFTYIYQHKGFRFRDISPARKKEGRSFPCGRNLERTDNRLPIDAMFYYRGEESLLAIWVKAEEGERIFLFEKNYVSVNRYVDIRTLMEESLDIDRISLEAILAYDRWNPEFHLKQYLEGAFSKYWHSENIFIPLLAADYHVLQELAAKAGADGLASRLSYPAYEMNPVLYTNLQEMFGLPISILRKMTLSVVTPFSVDLLRKVYQRDPAFLECERIIPEMILFMGDMDLANGRENARIRGGDAWSREEILRAIRFIGDRTDLDYRMYRDYLSLRGQLDDEEFSLVPGNLEEAHDRAITELNIRRIASQSAERDRFAKVVNEDSYRELCWGFTEEDKKALKEEAYFIDAPKNLTDLYREGREMHNCVFGYAPLVSSGYSGIYFLRKKAQPTKSYGTLEVRFGNRNRLVQAKAFANQRLPREAMNFVRQWIRVKGIQFVSC